jgi:DNA-binding MarR family transcriptional regulator
MTRLRAEAVAESLYVALRVLVRRLRQTRDDAVSVPEIAALLRLESSGPNTLTALAKEERISAQSLGATLSKLELRSLVERRADPEDGRQSVISITEAGRLTLRGRRSGRAAQLANALSGNFSVEELQTLRDAAPLLERLASAL